MEEDGLSGRVVEEPHRCSASEVVGLSNMKNEWGGSVERELYGSAGRRSMMTIETSMVCAV